MVSPDGEMVDTIDSKSIANKRGGSSPLQGRSFILEKKNVRTNNFVRTL